MPDARRIEDLIKNGFTKYMDTFNSNPIAFGMLADDFCDNTEMISKASPYDTKVYFGNRDFVEINGVNSGITAIIMDRGYNDGHSLAGISLASKARGHGKEYDIIVSSSEIARNIKSGIYDLVAKIINTNSGERIYLPEKYAMSDRGDNATLIFEFMCDIKKELNNKGGINKDKMRNILKTDENNEVKRGFYFADINRRGIENSCFRLYNWNDGFFIKSEGYNKGIPFFYHNSYHNKGLSPSDADHFEKKYEEIVYRILHGDCPIQDMLDSCMIIFNNKQKLEEVYPVRKAA